MHQFRTREMHYNQLGNSNLKLSAIGFGTCQLCLVPERQAIDTLKCGFRLGVNWVHTAPDYDGTENIIAKAIDESDQDIIVLSQGYGNPAHFEYLFENTCRILKKNRLEMFGIACIDDREYLGEDINGMISFLFKKKRQGRLGNIFCTTHGSPEYISNLITSGYFDAIILPYNILGFHLLSYYSKGQKPVENILKNKEHIFPLAEQHGVGLLIMKPLAGGLLCKGRAFPPYRQFSNINLNAPDVLREILTHPGVCGVLPGVASVEEAEENALAGYSPIEIPTERKKVLYQAVNTMKKKLCSRCGECEQYCSKELPISWLFRDAYICIYPSETFETIDQLQYFHLHKDSISSCSICKDVTCRCPNGIDIRNELTLIHSHMIYLKENGLLPFTPEIMDKSIIKGPFTVQIVRSHIPSSITSNEDNVCRFYLHNAGGNIWKADSVVLAVVINGEITQQISLRKDVEPGARTNIAFQIMAPEKAANYQIEFYLKNISKILVSSEATCIISSLILVH